MLPFMGDLDGVIGEGDKDNLNRTILCLNYERKAKPIIAEAKLKLFDISPKTKKKQRQQY